MKGQHKNSRESYMQSIMSGLIKTDSDKIVECMMTEPPLHEYQIASRLGWSDVYKVRRRMSKLITDGICVECGSVIYEGTNRPVRVCRLANDDDDRQRKIAEQDERMEVIGIDWSAEALAQGAEEWCIKKDKPCDAYNVVFALIEMGYIK